MYQVTYQEKIISFSHKIGKGLKHAYISVDLKNGVVLKSPGIPLYRAREIILKKAPWIINKLSTIKVPEKTELISGSKILYMGEFYPMIIIENPSAKNVSVNFSDFIFKIILNPELNEKEDRIKDKLSDFYRKKATEVITVRAKMWSRIMDLYPKEISFRKLTRRLGSCSTDNKVVFNFNIIKLPVNYIDYIIVHELAHIKEKNHSKNFWKIVEEYIPDRKSLRKKIFDFQINEV